MSKTSNAGTPIGCVGGIAILLVVHTSEEQYGEEEIRIISARKASPRERAFMIPLTAKQRRELTNLAARPDAAIDYSDAPETPARPSAIEVGRFYRPVKQLVSIRVDADVLAWFRDRGKKYQTYMNEVLRREMQTNGRAR